MSLDGDLNTISDSILVIADDAVIAYLASVAPWTLSPWISWLIKIVINFILNVLVTKTEFLVYIMAVTDKVNSQNTDFKTAVQNNQEMIIHGTSAQQAQARQDLIAAAAAFISLRAP